MINLPIYEWTVGDAQEAETVLKAAGNLIDAHLMTLDPSAPYPKGSVRRATPVGLTIRLDLGPMLAAIREAAEVRQHGEDNTPPAAPSTGATS
ncbi:hypothetical protein ABT224_19915 [Streptomyces sp. NPDC001584]|uniref:hypothetical protein n=1 Tax=Streptomyces sp. NPDC001584 TaxID=3154521 RepID=UPI00332D3A25